VYGYLYNDLDQLQIQQFDYTFDKSFDDIVVLPISANLPAQVYPKPASCVNISLPWGFKVKRACKLPPEQDALYIAPPPSVPMEQDSDAYNQLFQLPWVADRWDNYDRQFPFPRIVGFILGGGSVMPYNFGIGSGSPADFASGGSSGDQGGGNANPNIQGGGGVTPLIDAQGNLLGTGN
jgi:hypothetical protein